MKPLINKAKTKRAYKAYERIWLKYGIPVWLAVVVLLYLHGVFSQRSFSPLLSPWIALGMALTGLYLFFQGVVAVLNRNYTGGIFCFFLGSPLMYIGYVATIHTLSR